MKQENMSINKDDEDRSKREKFFQYSMFIKKQIVVKNQEAMSMIDTNYFRFDDQILKKTKVHGGNLEILFKRIRKRINYSSCNFIDFSIIPVNSSIPTHRHGANDEEIYIIFSGQGEMILDDKKINVCAGDLVINKPNGLHGLTNIGNEPLKLIVIDIRTSGSVEEPPKI